LDVGRKQG
jgi:hypothetical protein